MGPNKEVVLGIIRDGEEQTINLKLGRLAEQNVHKASLDHHAGGQIDSLGMTLAPAADVEGAGQTGMAVVSVDPDSKAAELGFQPGDVILKAGNRKVSSREDLTAAMSDAKAAGHKNTLVMVKREKADRYIAVPVAVG